MSTKSAGFTLLELLVVISLIVIVMSVVGVNLAGRSNSAQLKTQARQIVSALRSARVTALTEGQQINLEILNEGGAYRLAPNQLSKLTDEDGVDPADRGGGERDSDSGRSSNHKDTVLLPANFVLRLSGSQNGGNQNSEAENAETQYAEAQSTETQNIPGSLVGGVHFYPDGSSSGGGLELESPAGRRAIGINWLTGEVSLSE